MKRPYARIVGREPRFGQHCYSKRIVRTKCALVNRNERSLAADTSGGPVEKLALHPELAALCARGTSEAQRTQYFEQLFSQYSRAVRERVEALLSDERGNRDKLIQMIWSLVDPHVRVYKYPYKYHEIEEWTLSGDEFTSLSAQLSQQCALVDYPVFTVCNALREGKALPDYYVIKWGVLIAPVRAERLHDALPLLAALFERAQFVRRLVREHRFVPLLIGPTSQCDTVTQPFRDFCLSLNGGKLELGAIAQTLLRVYSDKSSEMAANAIDLLCKHHWVVNALELLIEFAQSNETTQNGLCTSHRALQCSRTISASGHRLEAAAEDVLRTRNGR